MFTVVWPSAVRLYAALAGVSPTACTWQVPRPCRVSTTMKERCSCALPEPNHVSATAAFWMPGATRTGTPRAARSIFTSLEGGVKITTQD
jgi:hypothetical protein